MKSIVVLTFAVLLIFSSAMSVNAQAGESIWLAANNTAFKTGEYVTVTINAVSTTPIQGFTFQIRYDPACLEPINATSPIPSMNGLLLPQTVGLVDASFASTAPQAANGVLAEVHFITLGGCQTNLTLESAALAIRSESGFAAPLAGVVIGEKDVALDIDEAAGIPSTPLVSGTPLSLSPSLSSDTSGPNVTTVLLILLLSVGGIFVVMFVLYKVLRR
jgi:hypothetical protein